MSTNTKKPPARKTTRRTLAAVALMLAVGMTGCARRDDPMVATAGSGAPKAGARAAAGNDQASALKFSQCMRDQGLTWFPDPDAEGNLGVHAPEGTDQGKVDKAEEACKAYSPWRGRQGTPISDADLKKLRQVSQCIRDHGFAKYPDPDANGSIKIHSDDIEPEDPAFQKARQECDKYMPAPRGRENS
ncbi:hypothetical protein GBF35_40725 [Nonomuraea phyllanthi]|uniref:hypothetical protein n=1 Tax=Nonomuraea phyllanthi TaxID=2219224 RepID=UPI0012940A1C|nr:hypothetical protein [Nonomuraea phyllanthi]QFY12064.1 hypothetical protein GBF35_40725 [Nonomuraea phyllanthi]